MADAPGTGSPYIANLYAEPGVVQFDPRNAESGAAGSQALTYFYNLRLQELVSGPDGFAVEPVMSARSPDNPTSYRHAFRHVDILPGRTYRVGAQLVIAGVPVTGFVNGSELAATFDLSSSVTANSATLTWGAVSGASGYEVRLGTGPTERANSSTSHTFTSLVGETTYTLSVRASYGGGVYSAWRSQDVTTLADPDRLRLTITDELVRCTSGALAVVSATIIGGAPPYERVGSLFTQSLTAAGPTTWIVRCPQTGNVFDGLTLTVTDGDNVSASATVQRETCPSRASGVPPQPVLSSPPTLAESSIAIAWDPVPCVTRYEVALSTLEPAPGARPHNISAVDRPLTSHTFARLREGVNYWVSLRAVRGSESSAWLHAPATSGGPRPGPEPETLELTRANTDSTTCVQGTRTVPVAWAASGGTEPFTVAGELQASGVTSGTVTVLCPATTGLQQIVFTISDAGDPQQSDTERLAINVVEPLAFELLADELSCQVGASVRLEWTLSGGFGAHTVSIDGTPVVTDGSTSHDYTCPATAGARRLTVAAVDSGLPQLSASRTLSLNVTSEPTVTARVWGRYLGAGQAEFKLELAGQVELLPTRRSLTVSSLAAGQWRQSSELTTAVDGANRALGRIQARLINTVCPPYLELRLARPDGTEVNFSKQRLEYATGVLNHWYHSEWRSFELASLAGEPGVVVPEMDLGGSTTAGAVEGPLGSGAVLTLGGPAAPCPTTPEASPGEITPTSVTLEWSESDGATGYQVRQGPSGRPISVAADVRSHPFTGLATGTAVTFYVRAVNHVAQSAWDSVTETPRTVTPLTLTLGAGPTSCETGEPITLSWTVSGSQDYTAQLDGRPAGATSGEIVCQATAGTQNVSVTVVDNADPARTATASLTLTVTAPPEVRVRVHARYAEQGSRKWVELKLELDGRVEHIEPRQRFVILTGSDAHVAGRWASSSMVMAEVGGSERAIAQISVRVIDTTCPEYVEIRLLRADGSVVTLTDNQFEYPVATVDAWTPTAWRSFELRRASSGASGATDPSQMLRAAAGNTDIDDEGVSGDSSSSVGCPSEPPNPSVGVVGETTATLNWGASDGATAYRVRLGSDGAVTRKAVNARSHDFEDLTTGVEQTLHVQAVNNVSESSWAAVSVIPRPSGTGEILARLLTDGRVELKFRLDGATEFAELPKRFLRVTGTNAARANEWRQSSEITTTIQGREWSVGRISVRLITSHCPEYVEISLLQADGERVLPQTRRFEYPLARYNSWNVTSEFDFGYVEVAGGATGQVEATDLLDAGEPGPLGVEGGLMSAALTEEARGASSACPAAPTNFRPSVAGQTEATLGWMAAIGAKSYQVRQGLSGSVGSPSGQLEHEFSGLSAGTAYTFYVRATNNVSESAWVAATLTTVPPEPSGLRASAITGASATLNWSAARGATGYQVREGANGRIENASGTLSHPFSGLSPGTTHRLYVRASNASGRSGFSSLDVLTVPAAPTLRLGAVTHDSVSVSWTAVTGATGYGAAACVDCVYDSITEPSYTFDGLEAETSYTFLVMAKNASGESVPATISATTGSAPEPVSVSVTGRVEARLRPSGNVEFGFRPAGGSRVLPRLRSVTPANMTIDAWRHSTAVIADVGGRSGLTLGKISVRKRDNLGYDYIDVCFTPQGASEATCPTSNNFRYATATVDRWLHTGNVTFTLTLGAAGSVDSSGSLMQPPDADSDDAGTDGELMEDD